MLASFFRIVALVRKELLAMLKDPRARAPSCLFHRHYSAWCSGMS
jgi:hypothetical protein